jgi:ATP-dependent Clp protease ATP-binding subunit ClpC
MENETANASDLKNFFKPEFLGRVDQTVLFKELNKADFEKIARKETEALTLLFAKENIRLGYPEDLFEMIAEMCIKNGKSPREMRNLLVKNARNKLALSMEDPDFKGDIFLSVKA